MFRYVRYVPPCTVHIGGFSRYRSRFLPTYTSLGRYSGQLLLPPPDCLLPPFSKHLQTLSLLCCTSDVSGRIELPSIPALLIWSKNHRLSLSSRNSLKQSIDSRADRFRPCCPPSPLLRSIDSRPNDLASSRPLRPRPPLALLQPAFVGLCVLFCSPRPPSSFSSPVLLGRTIIRHS